MHSYNHKPLFRLVVLLPEFGKTIPEAGEEAKRKSRRQSPRLNPFYTKRRPLPPSANRKSSKANKPARERDKTSRLRHVADCIDYNLIEVLKALEV